MKNKKGVRFSVEVIPQGKVTLPKRIRKAFGIEQGDHVVLELVEVLKVSDVEKKKEGGEKEDE
ncbi:hypothetical protein DRN97_04160 [Methanosarcinales archaeon]|nr:MAG: hypothetical protein DRN97_04160 [Methanosarcinales archaeon]